MELFVCTCSSAEHQFIVTVDKEEQQCYIMIHLTKFKFWKRLVTGIRYILGRQTPWGEFDEVILDTERIDKLITTLNQVYE